LPNLVEEARKLKLLSDEKLGEIVKSFDNRKNLSSEIHLIKKRLSELSEKGVYIPEVVEIYDHLEK
jgi:phosphopantothenate synthetase